MDTNFTNEIELHGFFERNVFRAARHRIRTCVCAFLLLLLFAARGASAKDLAERFQYDRSLPLKPAVREVSRNRDFVQYHVQYDSVNGERVPALLNIPLRGKAPFPCIIAQHGYTSSKKDNLIFALPLAREGYAMFSIDAQYHGERSQPGKDIFSVDLESDLRALTQTVIDLRRAVDYLETRPDIDEDRISYIGLSMGAILGAIFNGVDERPQAPVLVVGGGGWRTIISNSQIGPAITMRKYIADNNIDVEAFAGEMAGVDPLNFIWRIAPRPVLFINGKRDLLVPVESNILLHNMASEPKTIVWFDGIEGEPTGHIPPINEIMEICIKWWKENL